MERAVIALIVALVAFVASFNILTTLLITVTQKQKSISVLKALGDIQLAGPACFSHPRFFHWEHWRSVSPWAPALAFGISKILETFNVVDLPDLRLIGSTSGHI
jgi:lipoprotein-releasing system permease protein